MSVTSSIVHLLYLKSNHYEGSWVLEHFNPIYGIEVFCIPPVVNSYFNLGILFHEGPLHTIDFGGGAHFLKMVDYFGDNDYGLGFTIL
jgi:hypothetical protein